MKAFQGQPRIHIGLIDKIHQEKKQLILKENVLEFFTHVLTLEDMGGLDKLKDWLLKRKKAFSKEAREFGLDKPKGSPDHGRHRLRQEPGLQGHRHPVEPAPVPPGHEPGLFRDRRRARRRVRPRPEDHGFGGPGRALDRRDRKRHQRQAYRQRLLAHPGLLPDLDAGAYFGNIHRRHRQPHRSAAGRAAAPRPLRPDLLHRPAHAQGTGGDFHHPPDASETTT